MGTWAITSGSEETPLKYGILSDVHGNRDALEAVLEAFEEEGVEQRICLGDLVGYGAEPRECIQLIQDHCDVVVAGNHDFAVLDRISTNYFNIFAQESTSWTRYHLSESDRSYLNDLGLVHHHNGLSVVHGTLYSPELFDYIQTSYDAHLSMDVLPGTICFLGHSHVPITFIQKKVIYYSLDPETVIDPKAKYIVNVGSVGQPRDNNPKAAYAVYDSAEGVVRIKRVRYDVERAVRKIRKAGLPAVLGERLRHGR